MFDRRFMKSEPCIYQLDFDPFCLAVAWLFHLAYSAFRNQAISLASDLDDRCEDVEEEVRV